VPVQVKPSLGSSVAFDALIGGSIDIYVDYSGTIWTTVMKRRGKPPGREALLDEVEAYLAKEHGVTVAARLGFENAYALAVRRAQAEGWAVRRISDPAL
jgi:osmoprotectant transport system permease protein